MYMTKYEDIVKQAKNKNTSVDAIAKKYKMSVIDVKIMQEWKDKYEKAQIQLNHLQEELDKVKKEKNDLYNRIAELIEANEKEIKHLKWIKDHDYIFLVDENKKLHAELKKLKNGTRVERAREAGL